MNYVLLKLKNIFSFEKKLIFNTNIEIFCIYKISIVFDNIISVKKSLKKNDL